MDVDVLDASSSSIKAPPLFSAQLSPVVPEIDNLHTLEDENGDADIIVAANKGKTRDKKLSSRAKGKKKGRKQADRVELDDLAHKSPMDEPAAGNNGLEDDDFVEEAETKVISKKKALSKPTSAAKSKSKPKAKGRRKAVLSESENEDDGDDPRSRSPNPSRHLPEDEDSRDDNPKGSEIIVTPEITKIPPKTIAPPPKQTLSVTLQSRAFSIKPKSTPMSELIRRVNSQPTSPFSNGPSYSLLVKSSRTILSRIAPLHPNRRTPLPPLLRPPPPKKSNKQIEMEERIEDLSETIEGWSCMTDEERRDLRRA
ncbi:uncharacterized protein HD556DRAFT_1269155 [Suillus plorans]|uniref:Uncharacterized protein n=1 Tax=Suillus plorans TaxID=116603 RepID=A0A9P7DIQ8_9AGAM|nr:uncharacterized protein HD556DRAFT_1269155 [Suillus plorans]KAG1795317.1 hypothetical protein HD556DRAFT_1269155 [Suillus plorans]